MRKNAASLHADWRFCNDKESFWFCKKKAKKFMKIYELYVKEDRVFDPSIKAYHNDIKINDIEIPYNNFTDLTLDDLASIVVKFNYSPKAANKILEIKINTTI